MLNDYISNMCMGTAHTTTTSRTCNNYNQLRANHAEATVFVSVHKGLKQPKILEFERMMSSCPSPKHMNDLRDDKGQLYEHLPHKASLEITQGNCQVLKLLLNILHFA